MWEGVRDVTMLEYGIGHPSSSGELQEAIRLEAQASIHHLAPVCRSICIACPE